MKTKDETLAAAILDIAFISFLDRNAKPRKVSNCCGARVKQPDTSSREGVCDKCKEHCVAVSEEQ